MEESPRLELFYEGGKGWVYGKKKVDFSLNKCGVDEIKNRVKPLFNQVVEKMNSRTFPVLNAHGKRVDLFELFWAIGKLGGYDLVSRKNSWGGVAEECGFDFEEKTSMKLIYVKYLRELDRYLGKEITEFRLGNDGSKILGKLELLLDRLNQGVGVVLLDVVEEHKNDDKPKNNNNPRLLSDRSSSFISPRVNQSNDFANGDLIIDGEKDFLDVVENGDAFDEKSYEGYKRNRQESNNTVVPCSNKRIKKKMSPWIETLDWISHVATHFDDPGTGILSECLKKKKKKERGNDPLWNRALLARKLLLVKKDNANAESPHNQNLKMNPSMYEDIIAPSRISQRIPLVKCHYSCTCRNPSAKHNRVPEKKGVHEKPVRDVDILSKTDKKPEKYWEKTSDMHSLLGRDFQAVVPKWTGEKSASDPKFLGIRIWSPEDAIFEEELVGKGRPLKCDCPFPGSTECVRFHIAEKRLVLKREINSAFYKWRFDQTGEEVSLSWTEEEEHKFKEMIKFYSKDTNKFWRIAPKCFPSKTRGKMVRYYFNVLVLRRRSYQNRVTPRYPDSDDDEKDFGVVGSSFGHRSMCFVDVSSFGVCSLNMQCTNFEQPEQLPEP